MTDPTDTARQWLAYQICASAVEAGGRALDPPCDSCQGRASAILTASGVDISWEPYDTPPVRIVIRVPVAARQGGVRSAPDTDDPGH